MQRVDLDFQGPGPERLPFGGQFETLQRRTLQSNERKNRVGGLEEGETITGLQPAGWKDRLERGAGFQGLPG